MDKYEWWDKCSEEIEIEKYNCPDCNEAKLQSDKNARKINEVIEQVNALIQVNNETVDFIQEKVKEIIGDTPGINVDEKLDEINTEIDNINSSLDNLESEVNELKEGNIDIDLTNYVTKSEISTKADKTELHNHSNKSVLDGITSTNITNWNNKSNFSGNYNDLTNKPTIPTKTSQLANDSNFITSIPSEFVTETELTTHTSDTTSHITATERNTWNSKSNLTLGTTSTTAYRGDYGNTAYTHSQTAHAPSNAQKNSDITKAEIEAKLTGDVTTHTHSQYLTSHQSLVEYPKTTELSLGVHTDGLIYLFKGDTPMGGGIAQTVIQGGEVIDGDVIGYVDSDKTIVLNGDLESDTYTIKYELEDGTVITIGTLNLTNSDTPYINLSVPDDWYEGYRWSTSSNTAKESDGLNLTNEFVAKKGDVLRVKGLDLFGSASGQQSTIYGFSDTGSLTSFAVTAINKSVSADGVKDAVTKNGDIFTYTLFYNVDGQQSGNTGTTKIRITAPYLTGYDKNSVVITINEEITKG